MRKNFRIVPLCLALLGITLLAPVADAAPIHAATAAKKCSKAKAKHKKKCKKSKKRPGTQTGAVGDGTTSDTAKLGSPNGLYPGTAYPGGPVAYVDITVPSWTPGTLKAIDYYANRPGTVRFMLVGGGTDNVTVKQTVDVTITKAGQGTYTLPTPWTNVAKGDNLGFYEDQNGPLAYIEFNRQSMIQRYGEPNPSAGSTINYMVYVPEKYPYSAVVYPPNYKAPSKRPPGYGY